MQNVQPKTKVERKVPLGLVEGARAKDLIFTPSVEKLLVDESMSLFTTTIVK